jgi:predicted DNA-binding transcriptional regulator AlpA
MKNKQYLTTKELMIELGISRASIDRYVKQGLLVKYKIGNIAKGHSIFKREEIEAMLIPEQKK